MNSIPTQGCRVYTEGQNFKAPQSTAASFVRREFKRHLFLVNSQEISSKQIQNEKELIRLASAVVGGGGLAVSYFVFVESINLT